MNRRQAEGRKDNFDNACDKPLLSTRAIRNERSSAGSQWLAMQEGTPQVSSVFLPNIYQTTRELG